MLLCIAGLVELQISKGTERGSQSLCCVWQGEDGIYTGFIKVNLKLRRPVTVPAEVHPAAANQTPGVDKKTSFYLPLDAVKQLHISSTTTVSEVIQGLLNKFMVIDHPKKFALYRQTHRDGQGQSMIIIIMIMMRLWIRSFVPTRF